METPTVFRKWNLEPNGYFRFLLRKSNPPAKSNSTHDAGSGSEALSPTVSNNCPSAPRVAM